MRRPVFAGIAGIIVCLVPLSAALFSGCSSTTDAPALAAEAGVPEAGADAAFTHPPMPHVVNLGGPVVASPKIVAVTFQSDPLQSKIAAFVSAFAAAPDYWSGATAEYGVGPIVSGTALVLDELPPAKLDDLGVQAWLAAKLNPSAGDAGLDAGDGGDDAGAPFPPSDANTLYAIFYPTGVTITLDGAPSCDGFDGYHSDFPMGAGFVTYAVMARCPPQAPGLSAIDSLAATTSHEFIEWATDPIAQEHPAWSQPDPDHFAWYYGGGGGEIGDLCAPFPDSFYKPAGLPYLVQRVWSNKQAAADHDPCEPNGTSPYFNSAPVLNDVLMVNDPMAGMATTKGVKIPVGQTATVELDLYSDAPTSGPWSIQVLDIASAFYGGAPELSFALDKTTGQNGDKVQLSITVLKAGMGGASAFWIQNQLGTSHTVWIGLVGN